ncbi:hypothetical protein OQA88_6988 [Cercophora sp. LCS_1]
MAGAWVVERSIVPEGWEKQCTTPARPGHWTCIISDEYTEDDEACIIASPCILRSEMLGCLALLCRQMNKQYVWNAAERFEGWELDIRDGPIKVTTVTFTGMYVRVVQAACIPQASSPTVYLTYRGTFFVGTGLATWDVGVARDIIRWMMWPEEPPLPLAGEGAEQQQQQQQPQRPLLRLAAKDGGSRRVLEERAAGSHRVPSSGSDTTTEQSCRSTDASPRSTGSSRSFDSANDGKEATAASSAW